MVKRVVKRVVSELTCDLALEILVHVLGAHHVAQDEHFGLLLALHELLHEK